MLRRREIILVGALAAAGSACALQVSLDNPVTEPPQAVVPSPSPTEVAVAPPPMTPLAPAATQPASPTSGPITGDVRENARCRMGPGLRYNAASFLSAGDNVEVRDRNADASWWYVSIPGETESCWVSGALGDLEGDFDGLPAFTPGPTTTATPAPPTATPTQDLRVDFAAYCVSQGSAGATLEANNAFGWRCVDSQGTLRDRFDEQADVEEVCMWQFGLDHVSCSDLSDPYCWICEP